MPSCGGGGPGDMHVIDEDGHTTQGKRQVGRVRDVMWLPGHYVAAQGSQARVCVCVCVCVCVGVGLPLYLPKPDDSITCCL